MIADTSVRRHRSVFDTCSLSSYTKRSQPREQMQQKSGCFVVYLPRELPKTKYSNLLQTKLLPGLTSARCSCYIYYMHTLYTYIYIYVSGTKHQNPCSTPRNRRKYCSRSPELPTTEGVVYTQQPHDSSKRRREGIGDSCYQNFNPGRDSINAKRTLLPRIWACLIENRPSEPRRTEAAQVPLGECAIEGSKIPFR